jgi:hypothetical protein
MQIGTSEMDTRAINVLNKIRTAKSQWDTEKLQDPMEQPGMVPGAPATAPGTAPGGLSPEGLTGVMGTPPSPELDASAPLEGQIPPPSATPSGEMSKLDMIMKRRSPQKQSFLGGQNG